MGELVAWIIGWDLILEYAVSNMAVSVGFSQHIVTSLIGLAFIPTRVGSPPLTFPAALSTWKATRSTPGLASRLQLARVHHCDVADDDLGSRHTRVSRN